MAQSSHTVLRDIRTQLGQMEELLDELDVILNAATITRVQAMITNLKIQIDQMLEEQ